MHTTTAGIVLREVNYRESDKILTVLTEDAGKMTVSARGCRKKNAPTAAVSQRLCYSELTLFEYQNRWNLREGDIRREFRGVRSDLEKLALGAWLAELAETLTLDEEPAPEILRLLLNSLHALEQLDRPAALIKSVYELKIMALSGYAPLVEGCTVCGAEPEHPRLHLTQGALHCPDCREALGPGISLPLEPAALTAMRHVLFGEEKKLFSFRLSPKAQSALSAVTEAFVLTQLERGFSTLNFYKQCLFTENHL